MTDMVPKQQLALLWLVVAALFVFVLPQFSLSGTLIRLALVAVLVAVPALVMPSWAGIPNRWWAVLVLVVSGGLFIAGIAADRAANTEGVSFVSQHTWRNGLWPLAIDHGHLVCTGSPERPLPWFRALLDDRREMWPLDDAAMAAAAVLGPPFQPAIIPIQLHDTAAEEAPAGGPVRLPVDALRRRAITLGPCKGEGGP